MFFERLKELCLEREMTVTGFLKLMGLSTSTASCNRLPKKDSNRTLISAEALPLFAEGINAPTTEVANEYMEKLLDSYQVTINQLQVENSRLASQLEVKDLQIQSASDRLHESHVISLQLTDRQQALLQAAIDEEDHPVTIEPVKVETRKFKWPWQK